jgi:ADP-ribosylglycohydrolase
LDAARGALLGALVGDSAGSRWEFLGRAPNAEEVEQALGMPGGGVWRVAPGQVTDDGELSLALAGALAGEAEYHADKAAAAYVDWYRSAPFDIGVTTTNALGRFKPSKDGLAADLERVSQSMNMDSKANGALMRQAGLGIWASGASWEAAVDAARRDARLTHPNEACQWASAAYVAAIRSLVLLPGDKSAAWADAERVFEGAHSPEAQEVSSWLAEAKAGVLPPCHPLAGFASIAFTHAFHHLESETSYVEALRETMSGGGDTDTNCCIVGGLVGALHGEAGLPAEMVRKLEVCDTSKGRERPRWLHPKRARALAEALALAPVPKNKAQSDVDGAGGAGSWLAKLAKGIARGSGRR